MQLDTRLTGPEFRAASEIDRLRDALKPFAAVWEYDDSGRHFPEMAYAMRVPSRPDVRLHIVSDDLRRAAEALNGDR